MKRISTTFRNNTDYVVRPFALYNHIHGEYVQKEDISFADIAARDALSTANLFEGMIAYVQSDQTHYTWTLAGGWVAFGGGGGSVLYTNTTPMPAALGGLAKNTTFTNASIQSVLDGLLYPYVAIQADSLTATISNALREKGNSISSALTFTGNYTLGSDTLVDIKFLRNASIQQTDTINTWTETTAITDTTSFHVDVNDGTTVSRATRTYSFVYPFYYGVDAPGLTTAQIRTNFGATVTNAGDKVYSFAPTNQVYYFAYPASYGTLIRVLDWN